MHNNGSGSSRKVTAANGGANYSPNIIHLHGTHVAMIFRRFCPNPLNLRSSPQTVPEKSSDEHGKKA
ncbi:hypothetical protein D3C71_2216080 [compost metagenome]